jgi:hypothetical protein
MRDLMTFTIPDQENVEIVEQIDVVAELSGLAEETWSDCVIISLEKPGERPHIGDALLEECTSIKTLAAASENNTGFLYSTSIEIHSRSIEFSKEGLLNALRGNLESKVS